MARTAIHPGEHLAEELKALGMSAAALSRAINVPVNRITGIINGTRAITADTAIRLGHWFGSSAEFWLNLQKLYELRRAHADVGAAVERLPSLGAILRERSTRPDEDAPPHVQPQIIPGSTKKMHETDYRARTTATKARQSGVHKRAKRATRKAR
jgi:antitoxin HigA-1